LIRREFGQWRRMKGSEENENGGSGWCS